MIGYVTLGTNKYDEAAAFYYFLYLLILNIISHDKLSKIVYYIFQSLDFIHRLIITLFRGITLTFVDRVKNPNGYA